MNLDIFASSGFGDEPGLKSFFMAHRFIHDQTASALNAKFHVPVSSYGMGDQLAMERWLEVMKSGEKGQPVPRVLADWLYLHSQMHTNTYVLLGQTVTGAPDLSQVDFADAQAFDDWMYAHQQMHDFEQQQLGLL